jgi:hypothetical protein
MARATSKNGPRSGSGEYTVRDSDESAANATLKLSTSERKRAALPSLAPSQRTPRSAKFSLTVRASVLQSGLATNAVE